MNFVAIDFETATSERHSACAVGIVMVKDGVIAHEYHTLIQPPNNFYDWRTTRVHGLKSKDTRDAPSFLDVYPEIKRRLQGNLIVAHNEAFDRSVLRKTMEFYGLDYNELELAEKWECTVKKFKAKGYTSAKLNYCCDVHNIELNHHEALSDAIGCAKLYLV